MTHPQGHIVLNEKLLVVTVERADQMMGCGVVDERQRTISFLFLIFFLQVALSRHPSILLHEEIQTDLFCRSIWDFIYRTCDIAR